MRLYKAVCAWLEASAKQMGAEHEPIPEGNNFAQAEYAHAYTAAPELHAGYSSQSIDDDQGGAYRLGFQPNPRETT